MSKKIALMGKIFFGIVCFREKYWETNSFGDLIKSYNACANNENLHICIFDNTDIGDWNISEIFQVENIGVNVSYTHDNRNSGISIAYNYFAKNALDNGFEWLVFLDQDTHLPLNFYDIYMRNSSSLDAENIAFPRVYSGEKLISPSKYICYRTKKLNLQNDSKKILLNNITAINSGLMVKTDFFVNVGGYSNDLRLDFCDHEFIERLNGQEIRADLLDVELEQDFSSDTNDREKALVRYKLYVRDMKIYKLNKNKLLFLFRVDLAHLLKESLKNRTFGFLKIRLGL